MNDSVPAQELRRLYPPILTTAYVAEMMHCTIGDVRDKVHRKELKAMRWGQQFRFFRDEVPCDESRMASTSSTRAPQTRPNRTRYDGRADRL